MSKPATDARLAAEAKGFTQVIGRGNASLITKDPSTGKCCYDGQVGGGWHYGNGLETDTAFVPAAAPWDFQMTKALYNVYALSQFNNGQIIKWVDPTTGQYVTFQPMALQWTNSLNQIQQISMPQSVAAQANDDILYWPGAYGAGRNFRYQASPLRLNKQLIIDSPSALPSTSYDTLELNFVISVSRGVNIMVDGAAWDKKTKKDTVNAIAFQLPGGAVLWSFAVPRAWDSSGNPDTGSTNGTMRLKKQGNSLYVSLRFPKAWIDSISTDNYPITFDPNVDYQTSASANDGLWQTGVSLNIISEAWPMGRNTTAIYNSFALFTDVTIPDGATIDVAYLSFRYRSKAGTPPACSLYFNDADDPATITSIEDGNGRTLTTASISITGPGSGTWWNSSSIKSIIDELMASYSYGAGANMLVILVGAGSSGENYSHQYSYNYTGNVSGPKLHIEYTEAESGNPFYAYAQQ